MNETMVTLQGWLGGDVEVRVAGDAEVARFRIGCTPRRFSRKNNTWYDADTQWYTVNAWRSLGEHCRDSLHRGDPVVVHGRLNAQTWTNKAGLEVTSFEVEAMLVGHDLSKGVSSFTRTPGEGARDVVGDRGGDTTDGPDTSGSSASSGSTGSTGSTRSSGATQANAGAAA